MLIIKSILGGIFIAIASYIYLQTGGIAGAFLFSIGLLTILNMGFKLFTGTVGYIETKQDITTNLVILIGNILGCLLILNFPCSIVAIDIVTNKLLCTTLLLLIKSIICGMFIYIAVRNFKQGKDYMVVMSVMGFILFGAEHCIADLCFLFASRLFSWQAIKFLSIVTIGNSLGAYVLRQVDLN